MVNATECDLQKEHLEEMKKLVERNALDEDYRKDTYLPSKAAPTSGSVTTFKKREVKGNRKKR